MSIEFIKYQGEIQGEAELAARVREIQMRPFRKYGRLALAIARAGRLCWSEIRGGKSTKGHLVAHHISYGA